MRNMNYKIGDKVRINSREWYEDNCNRYGIVECGDYEFFEPMNEYCGEVVTITRVDNYYRVNIDAGAFCWTDEMIEGLVEHIDCKKCGLTHMSTRCLSMDNCPHNKQKNIIGEFAKVENNHLTETVVDTVRESNDRYRIVLDPRFDIEVDEGEYYVVRRKKEYPKTYEECCKVLGYDDRETYCVCHTCANERLFESLYRLKVCRDAYWKIAGEEMELEKPWEPDYTNAGEKKFSIWVDFGEIKLGGAFTTTQMMLSFPTEEMRNAFYENFKEDIEICKELL